MLQILHLKERATHAILGRFFLCWRWLPSVIVSCSLGLAGYEPDRSLESRNLFQRTLELLTTWARPPPSAPTFTRWKHSPSAFKSQVAHVYYMTGRSYSDSHFLVNLAVAYIIVVSFQELIRMIFFPKSSFTSMLCLCQSALETFTEDKEIKETQTEATRRTDKYRNIMSSFGRRVGKHSPPWDLTISASILTTIHPATI